MADTKVYTVVKNTFVEVYEPGDKPNQRNQSAPPRLRGTHDHSFSWDLLEPDSFLRQNLKGKSDGTFSGWPGEDNKATQTDKAPMFEQAPTHQPYDVGQINSPGSLGSNGFQKGSRFSFTWDGVYSGVGNLGGDADSDEDMPAYNLYKGLQAKSCKPYMSQHFLVS